MSEAVPSDERFLRLWARYERDVRRYVWTLTGQRSEVDDLVQETSVALWRKFDEYDAEKPFLPWAFRFANLEVMKHREKSSRRKRLFSDVVVTALAQERFAQQETLQQQREALDACLEQLNGEDRMLLEARYVRHGGVAGLAEATGAPARQLYASLDRVRRFLIECVSRRIAMEGWL